MQGLQRYKAAKHLLKDTNFIQEVDSFAKSSQLTKLKGFTFPTSMVNSSKWPFFIEKVLERGLAILSHSEKGSASFLCILPQKQSAIFSTLCKGNKFKRFLYENNASFFVTELYGLIPVVPLELHVLSYWASGPPFGGPRSPPAQDKKIQVYCLI